MNASPRISFTDSMLDAVIKVSEGNLGAATACIELSKCAAAIDPDSAFGLSAPVIAFDAHGIYGSSIWILYKDICHKDPVKVIGLLRAVQLGIISDTVLIAAINWQRQLPPEEIDRLIALVRERLPRFGLDVDESGAARAA